MEEALCTSYCLLAGPVDFIPFVTLTVVMTFIVFNYALCRD